MTYNGTLSVDAQGVSMIVLSSDSHNNSISVLPEHENQVNINTIDPSTMTTENVDNQHGNVIQWV